MKSREQKSGQRGTPLVEVGVALLILAVLATGLGSYLYLNQAALSLQRDRAVALEIANGRLEELRAQVFAALTALMPDTNYPTYYLYKDYTGGLFQNWTNSDQPYYESTNVNSVLTNAALLTEARLCGPSNCLELAVTVFFARGNSISNRVALQTFYYEP